MFGQCQGRVWADSRQVLCKFLAGFGQVLVLGWFWAGFGQSLGRVWAGSGQIPSRFGQAQCRF